MITYKSIWALAAALLLPLFAQAQAPAKAPFKDPESCLECHDDMLEEKVIHKAVKDGCLDCHSNLDAAKRPHKNNGPFPHGLDAAEPALCLGCHGKLLAKKTSTHKAIGDKGCTACHEAHSGKHGKLLKQPVPLLCQSCHEKKDFAGKVMHHPAKVGKCGECHDPHASNNISLLSKPPAQTCLECHEEIKDAPHMIAGFSRKGHPIGDEKHAKPVEDPLRPGKPFYCVSCHEPHRSEFAKLQRQDPKLGMQACQKCHQM
jgi:predicted CXXCH cytochrome family protein